VVDVAWFVAPFDGEARVGVFGGRLAPGVLTLPFVKVAGIFVANASVMLLGPVLANVSVLEPLTIVNRRFSNVPVPKFSAGETLNHEMLIEPFALAVEVDVELKIPNAG
jgi:hypothetical protein